jgi:hypothetical protein
MFCHIQHVLLVFSSSGSCHSFREDPSLASLGSHGMEKREGWELRHLSFHTFSFHESQVRSERDVMHEMLAHTHKQTNKQKHKQTINKQVSRTCICPLLYLNCIGSSLDCQSQIMHWHFWHVLHVHHQIVVVIPSEKIHIWSHLFPIE